METTHQQKNKHKNQFNIGDADRKADQETSFQPVKLVQKTYVDKRAEESTVSSSKNRNVEADSSSGKNSEEPRNTDSQSLLGKFRKLFKF